MIRKTFNDKQEATQYKESIIAQEGVAVVGALGDKFRVYARTKDMFEETKRWHGENYTKEDAQRFLRHIAWEASDAVSGALALQKMMANGDIYSDYESAIDAARIMESQRELKSASDVFRFIDDPHQYDKAMERIIEETFADYDYEAKEEVAKE